MNIPMITEHFRSPAGNGGTPKPSGWGSVRPAARVWVCALMLVMLSAFSTFAGLPEPMCVYYGEAVNGFGWPYTTNAEVILLHGTNEIASHTITGSLTPGINFALYVPLDDGSTAQPYSANALHSGDLVSIVVRDQEGQKTIMEEQQVPPVGKPGQLLMINATAGTDTNHDGLPDQWEQELVDWSGGALTNISQVHPQDDFDHDGQSNLAEYLAGTFPFLSYDYFHVVDSGPAANGRFRMTVLTVPGKIYGARYVTGMGLSRWTPSPIAVSDTAAFQTTPIEGTGGWLSIYVPDDLPNTFFRPTVESFGSYPLTATNYLFSLSAQDNAGNSPYSSTQFQVGDNGGTNFEPWLTLEGTASGGAQHLAGSIGGSASSWALDGTYAVGRSLPGIAHHGLWQIRMVHNPNNTGFSGFNLKSAALPGFDNTEVIRVGMIPQPIALVGKGINVSTDGGKTYKFLNCGWADGRGESIIYQFYWNESGRYTLTVINTNEGITSQFTGGLPTSAVSMLGVGVFGASTNESVQFDSLVFQTEPQLTVQVSGTDLVVSWLTGFPGYSLQASSDLAQSNWVPVGEPVYSDSGLNQVSVPLTSGFQFFRLNP